MGKLPYYTYSDSDDAESFTSSAQNAKKKKRLSSVLNFKSSSKKKYNVHSKSEPDESYRSSRSSSRSSVPTSRSRSRSNTVLKHKLRGILKHTERESSGEDTDIEPSWVVRSQGRCLVGQVPRPHGAKPGRGGGLAFVIKRSDANKFPSQSIDGTKKKRSLKRLSPKRSY